MMSRGLVQKNNLGDLLDPIQARTNLGLRTADYNRIRSLYTVAGLTNLSFQRIAGSTTNFQQQINSASTTITGINVNLYANKAGDTLTGTWTNTGTITASFFVVDGLTPTTDSLFTMSLDGSISANQAITLGFGLETYGVVASGSVSTSTLKSTPNTIGISINGIPYRIETT